jgi:DNA repair exonuclease SbcCD ATPase subunit
LDKKYKEIVAEIDGIDSRIDQLSEYPVISKKLDNLASHFVEISEKLNALGVVRVKSLKTIITSASNRVWYDSDGIVNALEKVTKREQMYSMQVNLPELKAEIDKYSSINLSEVSVELEELATKIISIKEAILNTETEVADYKKEITELHEINDSIINKEVMESQLKTLNTDRDQLLAKLTGMRDNLDNATHNREIMDELSKEISIHRAELNDATNKFSALQNRIEDIETTREEFGVLVKQQMVINLIREASSVKKGIPLIYVKIFLDDCVGIINDLISMVFGDAIEIKEFNITDKEFFIPYYKNGIEISDVKTASQGERAIISLALSFALMRKGIAKYNILLLDEIDGALYSKDREKFLMILAQQIQAINAEQVFLITHNNCFDGYPINVIMTTPEHVDNIDVPTLYV